MRCCGLNKNYKRCSNVQKMPFCRHHLFQPVGFLLMVLLIPFGINLMSSFMYDKIKEEKDINKIIESILIEKEIIEYNDGRISKAEIDSIVLKSQSNIEELIKEIAKQNIDLNERLTQIEIPIDLKLINVNIDNLLLDRINKQFEVLNQEFVEHGIKFILAGIKAIKIEELKKGNSIEVYNGLLSYINTNTRNDDLFLNLYLAELKGGLSYAGMPFPNIYTNKESYNLSNNYVIIEKGVLPEGPFKEFNEGKTIFDAIGHWLGLYHTFNNGCDGLGDHVDDTPAHENPTFGPEIKKACNGKDFLPIHNYMNYTPDSLMTEYTRGQVTRMKICLSLFRNQFLNKEYHNLIKLKKDDL